MSLGILWPSPSLVASECPRGGRFYEANRYVVTKVDVKATLDIAAQLRKFANGNGLPIHGRSAQTGGGDEHFNYLAFLESASLISGSLAVGYKVSLALVVPVLEDCDETAKTLEVVYRVYHLGYPGVPSGTAYSLQPPPVRITNKDLSEILLIQPGIGYDAARHFFGGGQMVIHSKIKGPVDSLSLVGYGSSSSLQLHAQVSGLKSGRPVL